MRAAARRAARHLAQMGYDPVAEELAALERRVRDLFGTQADFDAAVAKAVEQTPEPGLVRVVPGAPGYEYIRTLECMLCDHVSVRDHEQMAAAGWVHACPGCPSNHIIEPWSGS